MTQHQWSFVTVFAATLLLFAPTVFHAEDNADAETIRAMFARVNLDYAGLEKVKAAFADDDLPAAMAAYLEFWRTREDRRVLWNTQFRLRGMKMRNGAASDFFRDPAPRTISWRDRERLKGQLYLGNAWEYVDAPTDWTLLEMADLMLQDQLVHIRMGSFLPPMKMGSPWNWSAQANDDFYTNLFIHRHYFLPVLAQAYWATGDDKYVRKLVDLWTDWIRRAPQAKKDEGLGPMYQALLQPATLEMILESPELRPADFCLMLAYLTDHSLGRMTGPPRGGNQTIGQVNAILAVASAVPEFKDSGRWRELAVRYLTDFAREQCYPDGGLAETTFLYSAGTALALVTCVDSLKGMGVEAPTELTERTEKWGEHFLHCARPDGFLPWTGHGMRVEARDLLTQLARLHPERRDFMYYATRGSEGAPPDRSSVWFPWSGYCVMRATPGRKGFQPVRDGLKTRPTKITDYSPNANYLFFDVGPCGTFHRNADKLSIVVASHGRAMLEDQGIHTYTGKLPEFRTLCDYSYGHNTVIVDGLSQTMPDEIAKGPGDNPWVCNPVLDFNRGTYEGPYAPTNYTPEPDSSKAERITAGRFNVVAAWQDSTRMALRVDGKPAVTGSRAGVTKDVGGAALGNRVPGAASALNGDIAEVLIFDQALSDEDVSRIEEYLKTKYSLDDQPERDSVRFRDDEESWASAQRLIQVIRPVMWLRADDIDSGDTRQIRKVDNRLFVKHWNDASNRANHATQTREDWQPQCIVSEPTLSGRPVIRFDGKDDGLLLTAGSVGKVANVLLSDDTKTLFLVARFASTDSAEKHSRMLTGTLTNGNSRFVIEQDHTDGTAHYRYVQLTASGGPASLSGISHQRSVVFVKPDYWIVTDWMLPRSRSRETSGGREGNRSLTTSATEHTYEQLYHFIPCKVEQDPKTLAAWSATTDQPNLALIPVVRDGLTVEVACGRREPYPQGWSFPGGKPSQNPVPVPAPCVIYSQRATAPAVFLTVLWPQQQGETKRPSVESYGEPGSGCVKITLPDGRVDLYCCPSTVGDHTHGDVTFNGLAALIRLSPSGQPMTSRVVHGQSLYYAGTPMVAP